MRLSPDAAGIADEFPGWEAWRGVDRLWHARIRGAIPPVMVHGEDPEDLRHEVRRYLSVLAEQEWMSLPPEERERRAREDAEQRRNGAAGDRSAD